MHSSLNDRLGPPSVALLPGDHLGLSWRRIVPTDGPKIHELFIEAERADKPARKTALAEYAMLLATPTEKTTHDVIIGTDRSGVIQAIGAVKIDTATAAVARAGVQAIVRPKWRGRGIGRALLAWQDGRARQLLVDYFGKENTVSARIENWVDENATDRRRLYAAAGFSPRRTFKIMQRPAHMPLKDVRLPQGYQIKLWEESRCGEIYETHMRVFADHWGTPDQADEWWRYAYEGLATNRSWIVTGPEGQVVGYLMTSWSPETWLARGRTEIWIDLLGVDALHRGKKISAALLNEVILKAEKDGIEYLSLEADVDHELEVQKLYESFGFKATGGVVYYTIDL